MDGNSARTSLVKLESVESLDSGHSEKKIPAPTPIGTAISAAMPTIITEPRIAGPTPPPGTPTGVGRFVRKDRLIAGAPCMTTSATIRASGTRANTTATPTRAVISRSMNLLLRGVASDRMLSVMADRPQTLTLTPRVILQTRNLAKTLIARATKNRTSPSSTRAERYSAELASVNSLAITAESV